MAQLWLLHKELMRYKHSPLLEEESGFANPWDCWASKMWRERGISMHLEMSRINRRHIWNILPHKIATMGELLYPWYTAFPLFRSVLTLFKSVLMHLKEKSKQTDLNIFFPFSQHCQYPSKSCYSLTALTMLCFRENSDLAIAVKSHQ